MQSMFPEFKLVFRSNNQISICLQNVRTSYEKVYQRCLYSCPTSRYENDILVARRKAQINRKNYEQKSKAIASPPLDIIRKFQRRSEVSQIAGSGGIDIKIFSFVCEIYSRCKLWLVGRFRFIVWEYLANLLYRRSQYYLSKPKEFGSDAGQKILESGAMIDRLCGDRPEFAHCTTLTLPSSCKAAYRCLASYSGYCVNRLFQYLRRHYGDMNYYFFVWEYQRRGALHLHICHYHPDLSEGMLIGNKLIDLWHIILCDISENSGIDMFLSGKGDYCTIRRLHQHHTQPMQKSCGRYFAKYAKKSAKSGKKYYVRHFSKIFPPTRFWGRSRALKKMCDENSYEFSSYSIPSVSREKFDEMESILLEEEIILFKEYQWRIEVDVKTEVSRNNRIIQFLNRVNVSEGVRKIFYLKSEDYQRLLGIYRNA